MRRVRSYSRSNQRAWTRWDEIKQRAGNVRRMLIFAWLAATNDSALFAMVLFNSVRDEGDDLIHSVTMWDGKRERTYRG
jgi:hypothetical protein